MFLKTPKHIPTKRKAQLPVFLDHSTSEVMHFQPFLIIAPLMPILALARVPHTPTEKHGNFVGREFVGIELVGRDFGFGDPPQTGCVYLGCTCLLTFLIRLS